MEATEFMQTITSVTATIGQVVSSAVEWIGVWSARIIENPLLLILVVAVPLVGLGIGLLRRLIHT